MGTRPATRFLNGNGSPDTNGNTSLSGGNRMEHLSLVG